MGLRILEQAMNTFLILAAIMAGIAAAVVAAPLIRERQSRVLGAVVAILVIGAAAGLYPLWSNWNWHAPTGSQDSGGPEVAAMVAKLEGRLREQPSDLQGWLLLGRSYLSLQRLDEAIVAYGRAHQLDAQNADADIGLGEAMSLRAGGQITAPAAQMFESALVLEPTNPKALLYGGFAAAVRGDRQLARTRWEALKGLHPPPQILAMLDARIAELGATDAPAAGTNASPAGTGTPTGDLGAALVTVNIRVAPALKSRMTSEAPLFIFAQEPGARGPPLAAKRLTSAAIGTQIRLSASDSMLPGRVLVSGSRVSVTARVSFSGQPLAAAGDLYGELSYDVGRDGIRDLVIDRVAE
jgi:cytochrome c-type biogenesis protein CcmH